MKKNILLLAVILVSALTFTSCGKGKPAVELSKEMTEFVGMIKGTSSSVTSALNKFGASQAVKDDNMGMYDLKDPVVSAKKGDCYSVEFSAGITKRLYDICWANGKISSIKDNGMK